MEETKEVKGKEQEWHHVVTMEDLGGLKRKINIIYDATAVQMAFDKASEIVAKKVQVKGFRRGKTPKQLVERSHKEDIEKVSSSLLSQEGFLHACYEKKISPLTEPKVENADFKLDGSFSCDIMLEIKPTITPSGYLGLQLSKPPVDIEAMANQLLEDVKHQHMTNETRDEVKDGYVVTVDFWTLVDGKEISSGKDQQFIIKEGQEPPFGGNLIGAKMGDMKKEVISMPESIPDYGGKEAEVNVEVKLVIERIMPTDEELVERMQAPSYEELLNVLKKNAEMQAEGRQRKALEEQAVDKLIEMHEFDVPEGWVSDEERYLSGQLGLQSPDEEMLKTIHNMAERNVKRTFILESIYDAEKELAVTKEELDQVLKMEAERLGIGKLVLKNDLQKKGMMDGVVGMIKHRKVMDLILSQAQFEDPSEVNPDEPVIENPEDLGVPDNPLG